MGKTEMVSFKFNVQTQSYRFKTQMIEKTCLDLLIQHKPLK